MLWGLDPPGENDPAGATQRRTRGRRALQAPFEPPGGRIMRNWKVLAILVLIILIVVGLLLQALAYAHYHAARQLCQNNLKRIALALHPYHEQHDSFPPGASS